MKRRELRLLGGKRVNIILEEVDQEYAIPSHLEKYIKRGIIRP
jgi:hypothetical protein